MRSTSFALALLLSLALIVSGVAGQTAQPAAARLPILFVCGDSTAKSRPPIQGWGDPIADFVDPAKMTVENHAMGGRSSRTFVDEGRWEAVRAQAHKGDLILLQFGHNDTKGKMSLDRYTLPGLGDETEAGENPKTHEKITIHTFGFYMRKMISEGKATGATVVVLSPVPRNKWAEGKIVREEEHTGDWAKQLAAEANVPFVDVNATIAEIYEPIGQPKIKALYFPQDNTHTNPIGAKLNAACVVKGLLALDGLKIEANLRPDAPAEIAKIIAEVPAAAAATQPATRP